MLNKHCKASLRTCNNVWDVQVDVSLSNILNKLRMWLTAFNSPFWTPNKTMDVSLGE